MNVHRPWCTTDLKHSMGGAMWKADGHGWPIMKVVRRYCDSYHHTVMCKCQTAIQFRAVHVWMAHVHRTSYTRGITHSNGGRNMARRCPWFTDYKPGVKVLLLLLPYLWCASAGRGRSVRRWMCVLIMRLGYDAPQLSHIQLPQWINRILRICSRTHITTMSRSDQSLIWKCQGLIGSWRLALKGLCMLEWWRKVGVAQESKEMKLGVEKAAHWRPVKLASRYNCHPI
jgi:hypothetical protein